jgi:hypothetical protein
LLDLFQVKAVYHNFTIVKYDHWHDISVKVSMPLVVPTVFLLNISYFSQNTTLGEITFRLGTVASAVGDKDDNPLG